MLGESAKSQNALAARRRRRPPAASPRSSIRRSAARLGRVSGVLTFHTRPNALSATSTHQPGSVSPACRPRRAEAGKAWWLLCQASPMVRKPTRAHVVALDARALDVPGARPAVMREIADQPMPGERQEDAHGDAPEQPGPAADRPEREGPRRLLRHDRAVEQAVEAVFAHPPLDGQDRRMVEPELAMELPEPILEDRIAVGEEGVAAGPALRLVADVVLADDPRRAGHAHQRAAARRTGAPARAGSLSERWIRRRCMPREWPRQMVVAVVTRNRAKAPQVTLSGAPTRAPSAMAVHQIDLTGAQRTVPCITHRSAGRRSCAAR